MKDVGIAGLIKRFADLPDPRVEGRTDHDLLDIIVLALCAVMSGAELLGLKETLNYSQPSLSDELLGLR